MIEASPSSTRVLVAGIGNIFFGDDGFGCAVATELLAATVESPLPDGVRVVDYGIRGVHLRYDLLDGVGALVLVDAVPPGLGGADRPPGTVVRMQIGPDELVDGPQDAHGMSATAVLAGLGSLGADLPPTWLIGCVPADLADGIGLSDVVQDAVGPAADAVREFAGTLCARTNEGVA